MNGELHGLFQADLQERVDQPRSGTPEYKAMRERDYQRHLRAAAIIAEGRATTADDDSMQHRSFNTAIHPTMHGKPIYWRLKP